ncbi:hypothetical protein H257_03248 [Aphanomyces astaci]|uniref:Uncharacterized protein n=1 Tax=Aphanomyces astaci TaxID=112090 RepID=W4H1S8_APHAT|nr:hypothetical protein H257_03248 [Aphanomyces astaci]ETV85536.1 hypothetical protein H257_03248 [Aphanomyces astaci]|eukprot:XP_009825554.1 hypothetical protein H257_03248 [Aphanomyces astaci]
MEPSHAENHHQYRYGGSSKDSNDDNEQHPCHRRSGSMHRPSWHDMHHTARGDSSSTSFVMSCTWPSEDPLELMYTPSSGELWLPYHPRCSRPSQSQSDAPCFVTIDFGSMPQRVGQVDMTLSAQYVEVFAGHRTLHGDLRFAYAEPAFAMPDLGVPGRFTLDYACPDAEPFDAIAAIRSSLRKWTMCFRSILSV